MALHRVADLIEEPFGAHADRPEVLPLNRYCKSLLLDLEDKSNLRRRALRAMEKTRLEQQQKEIRAAEAEVEALRRAAEEAQDLRVPLGMPDLQDTRKAHDEEIMDASGLDETPTHAKDRTSRETFQTLPNTYPSMGIVHPLGFNGLHVSADLKQSSSRLLDDT